MGLNLTGLTGTPYSLVNDRLGTTTDTQYNILTYGVDNLYPQHGEQLRLSSSLVKASTEVLEDFLNGMGWSENGNIIINRFGDTYNDLLNMVSKDASRYSGAFAIHVNFDGKGVPVELQWLPFMYCRMEIPKGRDGRVTHLMVSDNWENTHVKRELKPKRYRIFNPLLAGEDAVKGRSQVLYYTGVENGMYPLLTWDSIINTAQADRDIQTYEKNSIARGFNGATILNYRGALESDDEKEIVKSKAEELIGPNSPGILVMLKDSEDTASTIETVDSNNTSDLFDATLGSVQDRVLQVFKQPPVIMGISPEGGVFTQLAYQEAYIVYNVITRNGRTGISRAINKLSALMKENLGKIVENKFSIEGQETVTPTVDG